VPVLIAMCGLPFSGKSVLAEALSRELRIRVLSYDYGIYPVHSRQAPAGSSVAAEYDFVQDVARREIGTILASGESLIYDDLLLGRGDRRKLAAVAEAHWADFVLVYLDTPLSVLAERRAANSRTRARTSIPEADMRLDISLLEPPQDAERAIYVSPDDVLPEVLARVSARLKGR
jgi:predicted kinase